MPKLIVLVGPPGSGKSTLAKQMVTDSPESLVYINQDSQGKEYENIFKQSLIKNENILIDRMNFSKEQRAKFLKPAKELGYCTEIVVLHECQKVCLERAIVRENHETIKDEKSARSALNLFFSKYERVQNDEADVVTRKWPAVWKEMVIVVDMDNTLSDATHREHFLQGAKKDWKSFFLNMVNDPVNLWCKMLIIGMNATQEVKTVICSARPDDYRKQTSEWLQEHDIEHKDLFMRRRGDFRKDSIIKEIIYEFEIKSQYHVLFVVDDRKDVVNMWRSHGETVLDCAGEKGNF